MSTVVHARSAGFTNISTESHVARGFITMPTTRQCGRLHKSSSATSDSLRFHPRRKTQNTRYTLCWNNWTAVVVIHPRICNYECAGSNHRREDDAGGAVVSQSRRSIAVARRRTASRRGGVYWLCTSTPQRDNVYVYSWIWKAHLSVQHVCDDR